MLPKLKIEIERWKWNKQEQMYVSNLGNFMDKNKQLIKPKVSACGYLQIDVTKNPKYPKYKVAHRIVMETWKPRKDSYNLTVDHLDHNKRHNAVKNLEWVTRQENQARADRDFIRLDYEKEQQQLKDKIRNLKQEVKSLEIIKNNENMFHLQAGNEVFSNWTEVYEWAVKTNPSAKDISMIRLKARIFAAIQLNQKYFNKTWKIV